MNNEKPVGVVLTDINEVTQEQVQQMELAPDFNTNKVLQGLVAKWREVHSPKE